VKKQIIIAVLLNLAFQTVHAAHPLVTDDTGTQGQGNHQIEVNTDRMRFERVYSSAGGFTYTYGLRETLDVFIDMPYTFTAPRGVNDVVLGAKWRFWEHDQLSLALAPEILLPTGDEHEELGNGRTGYALATLATYEAAPWTFHANIGTAINRYSLSEMADSNHRITWHTSAAVAYAVNDRWQIVADAGIERNPDKESTRHPAFIITGFIYSPNPQLDLDLGIRAGLGAEKGARQWGAGLTFRF
jgi:hypothetical protein